MSEEDVNSLVMSPGGVTELCKLLENRHFDDNQDGCIQIDELSDVLAMVAVDTSYVEANRESLFKSVCAFFDTNGDGKLQVKEIATNAKRLQLYMSKETEELTAAFKKFDTKNRGFITRRVLRDVLCKGNGMTQEEANVLLDNLEQFDKNDVGKFSYIEFLDMFVRGYFPFKTPENVEKVSVDQTYQMEKKE